jgi:hypothetical protein
LSSGANLSCRYQKYQPGDAWRILLPLVYLIHFFLGLVQWHASSPAIGDQPNAPLPRAARMYVLGAVAAGVDPLVVAALGCQSRNQTRFVIYLAQAVIASALKIRLPRLRGTVMMAAAVGVVQVLWRSARRPMLAQVLFNPACQALSAAVAYSVSRFALEPWLSHSVAGVLVVSTLVLYSSNAVMVATVLALAGAGGPEAAE